MMQHDLCESGTSYTSMVMSVSYMARGAPTIHRLLLAVRGGLSNQLLLGIKGAGVLLLLGDEVVELLHHRPLPVRELL